MKWLLRQLLFNLLKTLALLASVFLLIKLLLGYYADQREAEAVDPIYAVEVFSPLFPIRKVIASRKFHHPDGEPWDCTYAIVELAANAPERPPTSPENTHWYLEFGGNWQETPEPPLRETIRRALSFCSKYFEPEVSEVLSRALALKGSWYDRDSVGETLFIYSKPHQIAARIRYGD